MPMGFKGSMQARMQDRQYVLRRAVSRRSDWQGAPLGRPWARLGYKKPSRPPAHSAQADDAPHCSPKAKRRSQHERRLQR